MACVLDINEITSSSFPSPWPRAGWVSFSKVSPGFVGVGLSDLCFLYLCFLTVDTTLLLGRVAVASLCQSESLSRLGLHH